MVYKNYDIDTQSNDWNYFEAINLDNCDAPILFANTIEKLIIEIDEN
jgi:hypothetical protein